jgi:hypothetical protein
MGTIIKATAGPEKIEEHVRSALRAAAARGARIGEVASERLGPPIAAIDEAVAERKAARDRAKAAWALVEAEEEKADRAIGRIRDAMWNELGRPRRSAYLDQVFPDGVGTYTQGDVREQPTLMHVLHARLLSVSSPSLTQQQRREWAAALDALRTTLAAAVEAHRPAAAQAAVAEATYRAGVRGAVVGLQYFKRDLLNQGLTESQIHDIIPDAAPTGRASGAAKAAASQAGGTTENPAPSLGDSEAPGTSPLRASG